MSDFPSTIIFITDYEEEWYVMFINGEYRGAGHVIDGWYVARLIAALVNDENSYVPPLCVYKIFRNKEWFLVHGAFPKELSDDVWEEIKG